MRDLIDRQDLLNFMEAVERKLISYGVSDKHLEGYRLAISDIRIAPRVTEKTEQANA